MSKNFHEIRCGDLLLDAGGGYQPYKKLFAHARYESCDYLPVLIEADGANNVPQTFYCDLEAIPKQQGSYDVIICTQVLEHVKNPGKVVSEFYRILKPGGKLFLTAPQCFGIHMAPYNFFNYTSYGLEYIFKQSGFTIISIEPLGGIFWVLGKVIQKSHEAFSLRITPFFKVVLLPIDLLMRILMTLIFFIIFHIDNIDNKKAWTLGYGCYCIKPT
jgi:SAM-dependent methyltransferase